MKTPKGEVDDRIVELLNHEEILAKMSEAKSPQECYDVVKDTIDISFEEFTASMAVAKQFLEESAEGLLTDEELDMVAGGKLSQGDAMYTGVGVGAVVAVAALAGAAA